MSEAGSREPGSLDQPLVSRRNFLFWGGAFAVGYVTQTVTSGVERSVLRGPRWPVTWHRQSVDAAVIPWQRFEGHDEWLRLSDMYYHVGVMATDKAAFDKQHEAEVDSRHAVAWRVSADQIEVGVMDIGFNAPKQDPDRYLIGMGVGRGDLHASMGVWQPDKRLFTPASAGVTALEATTTYRMERDYPGALLV